MVDFNKTTGDYTPVIFGLVLTVTKIVPRDIDRLLLTTYPKQRMAIEVKPTPCKNPRCTICIQTCFYDALSQADGQALLAALPTTATVVHNYDPTQAYQLMEGTSMATPHVAGAAAVLRASPFSMSSLASAKRPPIASRIAARSTTHGTPVKSCSRTRAGMNWISSGVAFTSHLATYSTSDFRTTTPSSCRSRFSINTLIEYGTRSRLKPAADSAFRE